MCSTPKAVVLVLVVPSLALAAPPLNYVGTKTVTTAADGGLQPAVGTHNVQVYRANRTASSHADGLNHTYTHAPMLAHWRGQFYLEYLSGPRSEHEAPCVTSLLTSSDGLSWSAPRVIFPAFRLPNGEETLAHQRMGFYTAPDGRLLVLAFYGAMPSPNDGEGYGRAVREIGADGSLGPIYFIRINANAPKNFPGLKQPYPLFSESPDAGFVAACRALLADKLMTAQWWEEDALDQTGFYRVQGKALSYTRRPDKSVLGIWKNRLVATTKDEGQTWTTKEFAGNMPNNGSKYWVQQTGDGRYALVFNPTNRLRHPLAVLTSADSASFDGLLSVHGELPDQRFGGYLKNMGPQYVRGIMPGNGTPPDADRAMWLTYSVNKEDLWVARVAVPITATVDAPVNDTFDQVAAGSLPETWNIYSPLWAPVRVVDSGNSGRALELRDEDPYDYARAIRVFPASHGVKVTFKVLPRQANARFEIDLLDAAGARPVRLAFGADGHLWACHEGQWLDMGTYVANEWHRFELEIPRDPNADRCAVLVNGKSLLPRPAFFTDPVQTVERLSFRTGEFRDRGFGGRDLPGADQKAPLASYLIDDVEITPLR